MLWLQINSANPVYSQQSFLPSVIFFLSFIQHIQERCPSHISSWQHNRRRKYTENTYQAFIFDQTWAHHFCLHVFSQNKSAWAGKQRVYGNSISISTGITHIYKTQPHLSNDMGHSLDTSGARQLFFFFSVKLLVHYPTKWYWKCYTKVTNKQEQNLQQRSVSMKWVSAFQEVVNLIIRVSYSWFFSHIYKACTDISHITSHTIFRDDIQNNNQFSIDTSQWEQMWPCQNEC